jgi:hypothetical protein
VKCYRGGVVLLQLLAAVVRGGLRWLRLLLLLQLEDVLVASEAGPGQLPLVLLAHLADLGEVHGVVRHGAVLDVPLPERRHRHPAHRALRLQHGTQRVSRLAEDFISQQDFSAACGDESILAGSQNLERTCTNRREI